MIRAAGPAPRRAGLALLLLFAAACGESTGLAGGERMTLAGGDGQWGLPGSPLALPLGVRIVGAGGRPIRGLAVAWTALDGGSVAPAASLTDTAGNATARWILGSGSDVHQARAVAAGLDPVLFTAASAAPNPLPLDVVEPLTVETYDGSGQVVHPDVAQVPAGWSTEQLRLAITPYPRGNPSFENPSLFSARDPLAWLVPPGVVNPLERSATGYLSDPDILFDPGASELRLYYREVTNANEIRLIRSRDGLSWSAPVLVASAPDHQIISPSVVLRAPGDWWMWSIDGGAAGCTAAAASLDVRRSADGVHWTAPASASLTQPGFSPWHVDVEWIAGRHEFWALYNVKTPGSCTTPAVYLATSADGVAWTTYPSPVLARGAVSDFADIVYRSTLAYDPASDEVTFWYSGARYDGGGYVWHAAVERRRRADVFAQIASVSGGQPPAPTSAPPLIDWP